jgi:hypothetical protein
MIPATIAPVSSKAFVVVVSSTDSGVDFYAMRQRTDGLFFLGRIPVLPRRSALSEKAAEVVLKLKDN